MLLESEKLLWSFWSSGQNMCAYFSGASFGEIHSRSQLLCPLQRTVAERRRFSWKRRWAWILERAQYVYHRNYDGARATWFSNECELYNLFRWPQCEHEDSTAVLLSVAEIRMTPFDVHLFPARIKKHHFFLLVQLDP